MNAQLRNQHLPIANGPGKNLQLVPDAQQFQKPAEISLDFPFFVFVHEVDIFVNGWVVFQEIPQPGNALNEKMPPVVHQIPAVDYLFVPIFRLFKGIAVPDSGGDAGQLHILAVFIHDTAPAKEHALSGDGPQGQHRGMFTLPDTQVLPLFKGGSVHPAQPLGLFRAQIVVVELIHGNACLYRFAYIFS